MSEYNEAQKKVVEHLNGPLLVLAGPGSGKTFTITQRTKYLIEQCGIDPAKILVITFTKAAAGEMRERFEGLMKKKVSVNFGTFHAIFFKILKYAYHYTGENILREEEKYRIFQEIVQGLSLELEDEREFIEGISGEISVLKGDGMDISHYYSMNCSEEVFAQIYHAYEERLRRMRKIDFDDMLVLCYELFKARPDILSMWQRQFQYIMVDEAQDSNRLQFEITKMLAGDSRNLVLVGDDDQSLYRFRGARPEILLNFHKEFPDGKTILLNYNYRSQAKIVQGALRVIKNNQNRYPKAITAVRDAGSDIKIAICPGTQEENKRLLKLIQEQLEKGISYKDMAVLYRTNTQPRPLIHMFMEYNIPFRMKDVIPNIYDHWITKTVFAYIEAANGNNSRENMLRILNKPNRYIGREALKNTQVSIESLKAYYHDKSYMLDRLEKLEYDLNMIKGMRPYAALHYIRNVIGYDEYLTEYADYRRMKKEDLFEILDELKEEAKEFKDYNAWCLYVEEYREELKKQAEQRNTSDYDGISCMTYHSSKGLEFKVVFLIDVNEGITPYKKARSDEDIEEERRMFYVAMTRAKDELFLFSIKERYQKPLECSRFLGELLTDREELQPGTVVLHKTYGKGVIKKREQDKLQIQFEKELLPKTLQIDFCIRNQLLEICEK